jgi:hypothetical protein
MARPVRVCVDWGLVVGSFRLIVYVPTGNCVCVCSLCLHEAEGTNDANVPFHHALIGDGQHVWLDKSFTFIVFQDGKAGVCLTGSVVRFPPC